MLTLLVVENDLSHSCFGFQALIGCAYDPSKPYAVYFAPGAAVAALAFTLTVQQLLKPVYRFRLVTRRLPIGRLYVCVFFAVGLVLLAAVLPNIPAAHRGPWGYAENWEILAALLFSLAYGAVVVSVVYPAKVNPSRLPEFCQHAANLLSSADEQDHIDFANDLTRSLPTLIKAASFLDMLGDTSAFFDFIHRDKIQRAAYASSFLRIIADPAFCETLVTRLPWRVADMLLAVSTQQLFATGAEEFIRSLAFQAIIRDDSMIEREVGYHGFGTAPLLSDSLFSDLFLIRHYDPFRNFWAMSSDSVTPKLLKRFNSAAERCYSQLIEKGDIYHSQSAFSIRGFYRSAFMRAPDFQKLDAGYYFPLEVHRAVDLAIKMAMKLEESVPAAQLPALYSDNSRAYRADVLETLVEITDEALEAISNRFKGADDPFWITAIETFENAFPSIGQQPDGMTPFQQRLAVKIIKKLQQNMRGLYPALCRVLLSCIGPYQHQASQPNRTAFNVLKDAVYFELQQLPNLAARSPGQIGDFLPDNVTYNVATNELVHAYRRGNPTITNLSQLNLQQVDFFAPGIRR